MPLEIVKCRRAPIFFEGQGLLKMRRSLIKPKARRRECRVSELVKHECVLDLGTALREGQQKPFSGFVGRGVGIGQVDNVGLPMRRAEPVFYEKGGTIGGLGKLLRYAGVIRKIVKTNRALSGLLQIANHQSRTREPERVKLAAGKRGLARTGSFFAHDTRSSVDQHRGFGLVV